MSKALIVLKIFKVLHDFFGNIGKRLDEKAKAYFTTYKLQTRKQIITIHILPNISRSINMRNIVLEKSYTKCGGEAGARFYYRNQT